MKRTIRRLFEMLLAVLVAFTVIVTVQGHYFVIFATGIPIFLCIRTLYRLRDRTSRADRPAGPTDQPINRR
jgi:hypothetical protein